MELVIWNASISNTGYSVQGERTGLDFVLFVSTLGPALGSYQLPSQWVLGLKGPVCDSDYSPPSTADVYQECVDFTFVHDMQFRTLPYIFTFSESFIELSL